MVSFFQYFQESVHSKIEGFSDKWDKAVNSSEELRIALELMQTINDKFPNGEIYIVGGVPRDLLMGNSIDDVDMATNIPFEDLSKYYELRNISKNDSQPVYTILYKNYAYDLAKFREDAQSEMGRQNNISTEVDSFETDTKRRDITINSFGLDSKGRIVDYQNGIDDIKNKIIRTVGDAKDRFKEDATRILRVFRFAAKMNFDIDEQTLQSAIELKHLLQNPNLISQESIAQEFYKSAKSGKTLSNFLKRLQDSGILIDILPEFMAMDGMTHNPKHHPEGGSTVLGHIYECLNVSPFKDPVINLAVLFHDFGKATTRGEKNGHSTYYGHESAGVPIVQNIFKRLRFANLSQKDKENILAAVDKHMLVHNLNQLNTKTLRKLIHSPSWDTIKAVAFCDEASRGPGLFNADEFWKKIDNAEAKVGGASPEIGENLKKEISTYVNGYKFLEWFPQFETNRKLVGKYLPQLQDWVAEMILSKTPLTEDDVYNKAKEIVGV